MASLLKKMNLCDALRRQQYSRNENETSIVGVEYSEISVENRELYKC